MANLRLDRSVRCLLLLVGAAICFALVGTRAPASSPFDGVYSGDQTTTRGGAGSVICPNGPTTSITVSDGRFTAVYNSQNHIGVNLEIAADGSFSGTQRYGGGGGTMARVNGRITGNVLEADITGNTCAYHLSLKKQT